MVCHVLRIVVPHERSQNRLFDVAGLHCRLRSGRSENLERLIPIVRSIHGRMELV